MTLFDYVVLTIIAASIVLSVVRGLVREILSLLGWIAAFFVANTWGAQMASLLPAAVPGAMIRMMAGFLILFVATLLLATLVSMAVAGLIRAAGLQFADRGLGSVFGAARGVVIVLTVVILAGFTSIPQQPFWRDAKLSPLAESGVRAIKPYLPGSWAEHVHY